MEGALFWRASAPAMPHLPTARAAPSPTHRRFTGAGLALLAAAATRKASFACAACRARAEWGTWSTLLLLAISAGYIAVYVLSIWKNGWTVEDLTLNPLVGAAQPALMTLGAQTRASLTEDGQWWRLASSMFVTAGGRAGPA